MSKWKETIIGNYIDLISGFAFKSKNFLKEKTENSLPVIKIKNVANGDTNLKDVVYHKYDESLSRYLLSRGNVLIAMTGNHPHAMTQVVGDVSRYKLNVNSLLNQRVGKLVAKENSDINFIYYLFKDEEVQNNLSNKSSGSANQANISKIDILGLIINMPPLQEQKAIAEVLSSLDDKIDLLRRQNKTLESMAETLFRKWFIEDADENWEWCKIGEYVEVMRGLSYKGAGLTDKENGIPMHNLNSVFEGGGYKYEGIKFYSGDYKERHFVKPGDIIVTNTEQGHDMLLIGFPAIVPKYYSDIGIFSQHIYKLSLKDNTLTEPFLYYLIMSHDVREQITGATNGSTVNMLPKDGIEWAKFKMPPRKQIERFTNFTRPLLEKAETNYTQIKFLEKLRDTLLPKLMSGEVRVNKNLEMQ